jgi:hypothetical protein
MAYGHSGSYWVVILQTTQYASFFGVQQYATFNQPLNLRLLNQPCVAAFAEFCADTWAPIV